MGKSACGKDTIYKRLLENASLPLKTLVAYTTRPIRDGETHGVEYYFLTEQEQKELEQQGKIIELRSYQTVHGIWKYFTVNDHQINLEKYHYLIIGTLESYLKLKEYFGKDVLIPLYIDLEPGERLQRALDRERSQEEPRYAELCRRFLADSADFAEDKLLKAGIERRFSNKDLQECIQEITGYILEKLGI